MKHQRTQINRLVLSLAVTILLGSGIAYASYTQCGHHTETRTCETENEPEEASCPGVAYCPAGNPTCVGTYNAYITCTHTYGTCTIHVGECTE